MEELKRDFTIVIVTHNMQQAARVSDRTAFFTAEVDDDGRARRPARRVRRHREDLHRPERPPHRGLHHRAVRLSPLSPQRREQAARAGAGARRGARAARRSGRRVERDRLARRARRAAATACIVVDADGARGVPQPGGRALPRRRGTPTRSPRSAIDRAARRAPGRRARRERELQLFGPPAGRAAAPARSRSIGDERALGAAVVRPRRLGDPSGRERAPRLRREREPRAEDADRRARGAGRDAGRRRPTRP